MWDSTLLVTRVTLWQEFLVNPMPSVVALIEILWGCCDDCVKRKVVYTAPVSQRRGKNIFVKEGRVGDEQES